MRDPASWAGLTESAFQAEKKTSTTKPPNDLTTSPNPPCVYRCVGEQLFRFEPQRDLDLGVVGAVAAVDQVVLEADAEVTADGARRRLGAVGAAHHPTDHRDCF